MEFEINDKVVEKATGEVGVVIDKMLSELKKDYVYMVKYEKSSGMFAVDADDIEAFISPKEYRVETEIADNVVIGIIYEINGDLKTEVCRGHGHIIHEGAEGIAQACAYAYKKAFLEIDNGIYMKQRKKK